MSARRRWWRTAALVVICACVAGMFGAVTTAAIGSPAGARPLPIDSASLAQDGQQLVWRIQLADSFSPGALAHDGRSLCLLIERVATGSVTGQACVAGPGRRSRAPRLTYEAVTGADSGKPRVIEATLTRTSSRELTAAFLPSAVRTDYGPVRWQTVSTLAGTACAPPTPSQPTCFSLYPAKPTLLKLHQPELVGCEPAGPSLVYKGSSRRREVALTFDDGPWYQPPPSAFLDVFEREHVPATFFEIGRQISTYDPSGAYERRMLADGDMIGDHTWSHPSMPGLSASEQRSQLLDTAAAIRNATGGFTPCLWRPPYGAISPSLVSLARSLGFLTIMWDVDPRDWASPGVEAIYSNVVANARDGAIVLQHFGGGPRYQTLAALPQEIQTLRREGYRFVTVAEMLGLRLVYR
ncbi:MAG TPA: polysaccharide deacetylase family protein [Solirubrobacteraceae bacterium]|nr:polysaccharide deacetylase family protein [Solirubrobacteraceae bacterium]